jgi:hypothetical protein
MDRYYEEFFDTTVCVDVSTGYVAVLDVPAWPLCRRLPCRNKIQRFLSPSLLICPLWVVAVASLFTASLHAPQVSNTTTTATENGTFVQQLTRCSALRAN